MFQRLFPISATLIMLCACGGESSAPMEKATAAENNAVEKVATTSVGTPSSGRADVEFGNETLDGLSTIKCRGNSEKPRYSVKLYGKYQGERVTIVLMSRPDMRGAATINIRGNIWQLHEGEVVVAEDGKLFTASGTLKGQAMEKQEDGTSKLVSLNGDDVKPFRISINCP